MTSSDDASSCDDDGDPVQCHAGKDPGSSPNAPAGRLSDGAWDSFFRAKAPLVDAMLSRSPLPRQETEDCAQEVWLEIVRCFSRLNRRDSPAAFNAWLAKVVRTRLARQVRANEKFPRVLGGDASTPDRAVSEDEESGGFAEHDLVTIALGRLKKKTSQLTYSVFCLRMIEEQSAEEVARRLDLSVRQVWYRQHRAKRKFGEILKALIQ